MLKCDQVNQINIPFYEGLNMEEILGFAAGFSNGVSMKALPLTEKERLKLPREYVGNVVFTIVGAPFQKWVDDRVVARNKKVTEDKDLSIHMDPEIAKLFRESTTVSRKYLSFYIFKCQLIYLFGQQCKRAYLRTS